MKKTLFYPALPVFLWLLSHCVIHAQTQLAAFKDDNGLWGYINKKGEVVIEAKYSNIKAFSRDGLALVKEKKSKEFVYINSKGDELKLDCTPDRFGNFSEGRAMVRINEKWGYIDTEGKLVIEAKYTNTTDFYSGKAIVQNGAGKVLVIDKAGVEIDVTGLGITDFKEFSEGLAPVRINDGNWGFLSLDGKLAIEASYVRVGYFTAGLAWVRTGDDQVGFIDKSNNLVIKPVYVAVKEFDPVSERARVKNSAGEWLYINKEGSELRVDADHFGDFSEGLCSLDQSSNSGVYGFIDKEGKWVIEPKFEATGDFHLGVCRVRNNKLWGFIDKDGNVIIETKFDGVHDFAPID